MVPSHHHHQWANREPRDLRNDNDLRRSMSDRRQRSDWWLLLRAPIPVQLQLPLQLHRRPTLQMRLWTRASSVSLPYTCLHLGRVLYQYPSCMVQEDSQNGLQRSTCNLERRTIYAQVLILIKSQIDKERE